MAPSTWWFLGLELVPTDWTRVGLLQPWYDASLAEKVLAWQTKELRTPRFKLFEADSAGVTRVGIIRRHRRQRIDGPARGWSGATPLWRGVLGALGANRTLHEQ